MKPASNSRLKIETLAGVLAIAALAVMLGAGRLLPMASLAGSATGASVGYCQTEQGISGRSLFVCGDHPVQSGKTFSLTPGVLSFVPSSQQQVANFGPGEGYNRRYQRLHARAIAQQGGSRLGSIAQSDGNVEFDKMKWFSRQSSQRMYQDALLAEAQANK